MLDLLIHSMVYLGAALMVYNIYGFTRFAGSMRSYKGWKVGTRILYLPVGLLVMFLAGYLIVGVFGRPDLVVAGILFGGSIFVFVMYRLLTFITGQIMEGEQLEAQLMAAEEANRAKTSFLAGISHEMRTPMNVILGLDGLAMKDPALSADTKDKLEKIELSALHLLGLINNLLDMNRIETGSLEVKQEPFRLRNAVEQVSAITQTICDEKGLTYSMVLPEETDCRVLGDEILLKQILLSILDNAVKYTNAPGKVTLEADCQEQTDTQRIFRFRVRDTGIGIDSEFLPRLFDAFTREDESATSRYGESGLGMAAARKMAEMMQGTISAESVKDKGSVFTVTIPFPVCADTGGEEEAPGLDGRRILVVEDTPENAEIVMDLLELEGAESELAENGKVGLEMFAEKPAGYYDAILMDLRMPVMDGLEATRRIRDLDRPDAKRIPIIALTANAYQSDVQKSLEAGMDRHLAKPADADLLYDTIRRILQEREKEK